MDAADVLGYFFESVNIKYTWPYIAENLQNSRERGIELITISELWFGKIYLPISPN